MKLANLLSVSLIALGVVSFSHGQTTSPWPFAPKQTTTPLTQPATVGAPAATRVLAADVLRPGLAQPAQGISTAEIKVIKDAGSLTPTTKPFVHPGMYYSGSDLEFMRKKLAAKAEPWFSAWQQSKPNGRDNGWVPHATAEWDMSKTDMYTSGDSVIAHKEALEWALTGDKASAAKAIEILNAWASKLKTIPSHKMPQEKLACGANVGQFANAAELLCYGGPNGKSSGWSSADIQQFKVLLGKYYEVMKDFMPGFNGNWDALMMNSMMCSAIFLDDHAMFDRALKHYVVGEKPNGGLTNYIFSSGQCQESGRDQGHVQWGISGLIAACEVAWKQGIDIYGMENNRLMLGLEYTAKYNLGNDVVFEGKGGPWDAKQISAGGRGSFAPIWETAYQHYVYRKGLEMPYTKQIIFGDKIVVGGRNKGVPGPYRPEGSYTVGISWGTFTMFKGTAN